MTHGGSFALTGDVSRVKVDGCNGAEEWTGRIWGENCR